ncbi:MAG: carbohydrate porin [Paraprevotella sp.]|nr:carbohydrate porin [Paraprevotella sp.]
MDNGDNRYGISFQHATFVQGKELSLEATWHRTINDQIALQPAFQYIKNDNGKFTVLCMRLYYTF